LLAPASRRPPPIPGGRRHYGVDTGRTGAATTGACLVDSNPLVGNLVWFFDDLDPTHQRHLITHCPPHKLIWRRRPVNWKSSKQGELEPRQRPSVELRVARKGFQRNKNEKRVTTRPRPGIPKSADSAGRGRPYESRAGPARCEAGSKRGRSWR